MTALANGPAHGAPHGLRLLPGRLFGLELRRSTMLWMLPPLAVLLWFTALSRYFSYPPVWYLRSANAQWLVDPTGAIVAGVAAWTASRDGRRNATDLLATTARPLWARQLVTWAAVTAWAMLLYAACVALIFGVTASRATWGGPIWWLAGVGMAAIVACSAIGFAFGAFFPSQFVAPLVAVGTALASQAGGLAVHRNHPWGVIGPIADPTVPGTGIFFPFHPGLSIVQIMFLAGLTALALGALALPAAGGGRGLRLAGAVIAIAGLGAASTGVALADTARTTSQGIVIPALHSAVSDKPISFTPVCDPGSAVPVCLQRAYQAILETVVAAIGPVLSQVAGLHGTPVRVTQLGTLNPLGYDMVRGDPPVLYLPPIFPLPGQIDPAEFTQYMRETAARAITGAAKGSGSSTAQQVVATALTIIASGSKAPAALPGSTAAQLDQEAQRFAALPAAARRAWLGAHLTALQAGRITVRELP